MPEETRAQTHFDSEPEPGTPSALRKEQLPSEEQTRAPSEDLAAPRPGTEAQTGGGASAGVEMGEQRLQAEVSLLHPASFPKPEPARWQLRDLLLFVAFSVVWTFLSALISAAGYAILRPIMGWKTPTAAILDNTFFALLGQVVLYGPVLLYIVLLVVVRYRQSFWAGIGWRWPGRRPAVKLIFGGVLLAIAVAAASTLLPDRKDFPLEKMFSSPAAAYALGCFAVLVAPFMEELIFRGVLFAFFERLAGLRWAVAVTAVLFAALHYFDYRGAWTHLAMILIVGLVFSLTRALTRSLAPSFILHTAYNATFMLALFVGTHHFRNLQTLSAP